LFGSRPRFGVFLRHSDLPARRHPAPRHLHPRHRCCCSGRSTPSHRLPCVPLLARHGSSPLWSSWRCCWRRHQRLPRPSLPRPPLSQRSLHRAADTLTSAWGASSPGRAHVRERPTVRCRSVSQVCAAAAAEAAATATAQGARCLGCRSFGLAADVRLCLLWPELMICCAGQFKFKRIGRKACRSPQAALSFAFPPPPPEPLRFMQDDGGVAGSFRPLKVHEIERNLWNLRSGGTATGATAPRQSQHKPMMP
jgi:hypothetical protein